MKPINLFELFYECEIANFNEDFCNSLALMLNDGLAQDLISFVNDFYAGNYSYNPQLQELVELGVSNLVTYTLPRAKSLTLHVYLRTEIVGRQSAYDFLLSLNPEHIYDYMSMDYDRNKIVEVISEIEEWSSQMLVTIEPRKRADYDKFTKMVDKLSDRSKAIHRLCPGTICSTNLVNIVHANRDLFYNMKEKTRNTGLRFIIEKMTDLTIIRKGLQYKQWCDANGILMRNGGSI